MIGNINNSFKNYSVPLKSISYRGKQEIINDSQYETSHQEKKRLHTKLKIVGVVLAVLTISIGLLIHKANKLFTKISNETGLSKSTLFGLCLDFKNIKRVDKLDLTSFTRECQAIERKHNLPNNIEYRLYKNTTPEIPGMSEEDAKKLYIFQVMKNDMEIYKSGIIADSVDKNLSQRLNGGTLKITNIVEEEI